MKYSLRFTFDKKHEQIYLTFSTDSKRLLVYTGLRCHSESWNAKTQQVGSSESTESKGAKKQPKYNQYNQYNQHNQSFYSINNELLNIRNIATRLIEKMVVNEEPLNHAILKERLLVALGRKKEVIKDVFTYFDKYILEHEMSEGRKKQMHVTKKHFSLFCESKPLQFKDTGKSTLEGFYKYLKAEKQLSENTIVTNFKRLRSFVNYALAKEWTQTDMFKGYVMPRENYSDDIIYLNREEQKVLCDFDLSENEALQRCRDLFVFQMSVGCRVGDLMKLTKNNIVSGDLVYIATKTKNDKSSTITIPLSNRVLSILDKYKDEAQILPFISSHRYNIRLKELFKFCGLNREIVRLNPTTKEQETVLLCDIIASHAARRTLIGTLQADGISLEVISSMSGHSKNSKEITRYYNIERKQKEKAIKGL